MKLLGPILVGPRLQRDIHEALRQAAELANDLGTNVTVCHVVAELDILFTVR